MNGMVQGVERGLPAKGAMVGRGCPLLSLRALRDRRPPSQSTKPMRIKRPASAVQDTSFQLLESF